MAKKAAPAALQIEVNTDEEWEKILARPGLILADVFSDWSGPCAGMVSILKKIKMEIGGDNLNYATAKCDNIAALSRFQGKSEPTWMFIRNGKMVNLLFGANCPELVELITAELKRLENNDPPIFSIDTAEISPVEAERLEVIRKANAVKEAIKKAERDAKAKKKYEAELAHLTSSLAKETCIILFSWIFRDEEGNKIEKKSAAPYIQLIEEIFPAQFSVEQEVRKALDLDILENIQKETTYVFSDETKKLLLDAKCLCMRLKAYENDPELDVDKFLLSLIYEETELPKTTGELVEGCFAQKYVPLLPRERSISHQDESMSQTSEGTIPEDKVVLNLNVIWVPENIRNRVLAIRSLFPKYVETNFPYEDPESDVPITVFKYDSTRKKELKMVLELYNSEVLNFGVFERDKIPEPKLIAKSIDQFEDIIKEKSSYEVFVTVIKRVGSEAFLTFAGIGPYHVSENQEKAVEEAKNYFPNIFEGKEEEIQSDEEDKADKDENKEEQEPEQEVAV